VINELLDKSLRCGHKHPQYAYIAPTYGQAKRVAWDILKEYTRNIPGVEYHEGELRMTIPRPWLQDKIKILLLGAETPDSIRGLYLDGVVFDEFADCDPRVWTTVVRAALSDRLGWAIFIGTPKGMNHLFDVLQVAKRNPGNEWFFSIFRASETNIVAASELEQARAIMSEDEYNQEFECFPPGSLVATTRGQIPIEKIRCGDFVLTHKNRWRPVTATMKKHYSGELVAVTSYGNGKPILCTPEHPFLVYDKESQTREWKKAGDLTPEDCLVLPKISKLGIIYRVRSTTRVPYSGDVHNISVKEDESYVVEGKAVHNCDFSAALIGAFYGKEMVKAEKENRLTRVPYEQTVPVTTYWDLGINDSTAIWFMQCVGRGEWHAINYLENSGQSLDFYAKELKNLGYYYERHVLPHDARVRSFETGRTRVEVLEKLDIKPIDVLENHPVMDGINAARVVLSKVYFNVDTCQRGIDCLKNYQKKWDSRNKIYSNTPLHDWASNGADAFRYFALGREDKVNGRIIGGPRSTDLPRQAETDYDIFSV